VHALAVTNDGRFVLASGAEPRIRWFNVADGGTARFSDGHSALVNDIVFAADGRTFASASADKTVRVWDTGGGGQIRAFTDATDWNYRAALSPDGKLVAGGGAEGIVRLWDVGAGTLRASLVARPPSKPGAPTEWAVITAPGYLDSSPAWSAAARLSVGALLARAGAQPILKLLKNPDLARKALAGEKVDSPAIPAPSAPAAGK
jgi:WD40 repeat protein